MNKIQKIAGGMVIAMICLMGTYETVLAESNRQLEGDGQRDIYGADYYATSSIREWMNSDKQNVEYTNLPPSSGNASPAYDKEPGFLTTFTPEEQSAIAVTEHKAYLSSKDSIMKETGTGTFDTNPFNSESVRFSVTSLDSYETRFAHTVRDKVFLLTPYQYYQFVEKRNLDGVKSLTASARLKYNRTELYTNWWLQAGISNIGTDNNYYVTSTRSNSVSRTSPVGAMGFVPAMHLLPNAIVSGKKASEYKIGENIVFGRYMGEPIVWKIVNKTSQGAPLLLSEKILDIKSFDAKGDKYSNSISKTIQFDRVDVPKSETERYAPFDGQVDTQEPKMIVTNEDKLFSRSNDSFSIDFKVEDVGSGVDYIILPNGQIITSTIFSYEVKQNSIYHFRAVDRAGNLKVFAVPVANINPESSVIIKSSANGWTNKDVTVDISASNQVGLFNRTFTLDSRSTGIYNFPNFTSYANKRIRVTGTMEATRIDGTKNPTAGVGFYYRSSFKRDGEYFLQNVWTSPIINIPMETLQKNGKVAFEGIYEIPGNYFDSLTTHHTTNALVGDYNYSVLFENNTFELIDNDDFGIEKIILPNGTEVKASTYRDTLSKEGNYSYQVIDSRGKVTEKNIEVKIDKELPSIQATLRTNNWVSGEQWIDVNVNDVLSGVKELALPNGQIVQGKTFAYRITQNGSYTFTATDNAGNRSTKTISVSNFDDTAPTATIVFSQTGWTNQDVVLLFTAIDKQSGISMIELPNGTRINSDKSEYRISTNGTYTFKAWDKVGQVQTFPVSVSTIDKKIPIILIKDRKEGANTVVNITTMDN